MTPSAIYETLTGLGTDVVSVLLPRPDIEVGGEKLRIATKNAAQLIDGAAGDHSALKERLSHFDTDDLQSAGAAFYSADGAVYEVRLNEPPVAMATLGGDALWLPVVADASSRASAWAIVIDQQAPRLLRISSKGAEDYSDIVALPDYDDIESRREPQLDMLFHSTSSGQRTRGHGSMSKFHSLGTSQRQEEEKTESEFFRALADVALEGLPRTARKLFLIGDDRSVGHTKTHLNDARFDVEILSDAGDGSDEDRLVKAVQDELEAERRVAGFETLSDLAPSSMISLADLETAGTNGRVETVWLASEAAGLREFADDEYFDFDDPEPAKAVANLQSVIAHAMRTGAGLTAVPGVLLPDGASVIATSRYDVAAS